MEVDPSDDKIMFVDLEVNFEITGLREAYMVLQGLGEAAVAFYDEYHYQAYPVYRIEQ